MRRKFDAMRGIAKSVLRRTVPRMNAESRTRALRLVFERRGKDVRLLEAIPLDVVVPPGDPLDVDDAEHAGFAVRLYGDDGALVYRRVMHDPLAREAEVWTGDPERPWERVPVTDATVVFDVVVPNAADAPEVELVASPVRHSRDEPHRPARPILRTPVWGGGDDAHGGKHEGKRGRGHEQHGRGLGKGHDRHDDGGDGGRRE
jgi:hypothetical protein